MNADILEYCTIFFSLFAGILLQKFIFDRIDNPLKQKLFVVWQCCVVNITVDDNFKQTTNIDCFIRTIRANNETEAIGVFVKETESIEVKERFKIFSYEVTI